MRCNGTYFPMLLTEELIAPIFGIDKKKLQALKHQMNSHTLNGTYPTELTIMGEMIFSVIVNMLEILTVGKESLV